MSYPTVLGPWFVVQRYAPAYCPGDGCSEWEIGQTREYYTMMEDGGPIFQADPKRAMLFMSLNSAARVASAEGTEVRVLTSREEAEEFGRG